MVCGRRRSSRCQLHLDWVVVADCQGLEEGERWGGVTQGFSEPQAPHGADGAGRAAAITLPEPSACWGGTQRPQPQDTPGARLSFSTSRGEMPRRSWGGQWQGGPCHPRPPYLA